MSAQDNGPPLREAWSPPAHGQPLSSLASRQACDPAGPGGRHPSAGAGLDVGGGCGHHSQPCWPPGRLRPRSPIQPHPGKFSHAVCLGVTICRTGRVMPASWRGGGPETPQGPTQKEQHAEPCKWVGRGTLWHLRLRSAQLTGPQGAAQAIGLAPDMEDSTATAMRSLPAASFLLESLPHTPPS